MTWSSLLLRLLSAAGVAIALMVASLFLSWASRSARARMRRARSGAHAGSYPQFQGVTGTIKLLAQGLVIPEGEDPVILLAAPIAALGLAIGVWAVIPLGPGELQVVDLEIGALYVVAFWALAPLPVIMAGWGSGNGHAGVEALRAASQTTGYAMPVILMMLVPVVLSGSLSLQTIVEAQTVPYTLSAPLAALLFIIAGTAARGVEVVTPYLTVYGGMMFGAFRLAEVINSFTVSVVFSVLFLGGWRGPWVAQVPWLGVVWLLLKAFVVYIVLVLFWTALPRLRMDQHLAFSWTFMVPLGLTVLSAVALVEKLIDRLGVTSPWGRSLALLATNMLIGLGLVAVLVGVERARQRLGTARVGEGR
jgi:NADH-quinone oxidoreductase subunit H